MTEEIKKVLEDPTASNWLKGALTTALRRDAVDAVGDASVLHKLLNQRLARIQGTATCGICQREHV